ncbi:MAG: hypothetical protein ACXVCH_10310 [Bdellovibrionota bacterium]
MSKKRTAVEGRIHFAKDIPDKQAQAMIQDLNLLRSMDIQSSDPEFVKKLKLDHVDARSMEDWLAERVQYIVGENFNIQQAAYVDRPYFSFENENQSPVLEYPTATPHSTPGSRVVTVMSNIGGAVYFAGKKAGTLYGVKIPGIGKIPLSSPRVGLLEVGEGMFITTKTLKKVGTESKAGQLIRLATLFHEARHSDGHGTSLGFFHAVCPKGHDYEGYSACDRNLNGAYTIGAQVTKALLESCSTCSEAEREALKMEYLDSASRVIQETPMSQGELDAEIQRLTDSQSVCPIYQQFPDMKDVPEVCKNPDAVTKQIEELRAHPPGTPSVDWDDAPEGRRS